MPFRTSSAPDDLDARFFAAEGESRRFSQEALAGTDRFGNGFAGAAAAFFGASFVDFVGALGGVGQNQYLVAGDLQKATADGHRFFGTTFFDPHHAWQQSRQKWRVPRQDTYDALGARGDHHIHGVFGEDFTLGGDDLHT